MSNCFSSPDDSKDEPEFKPAKARGCTDVFWLVIYIVFWLFMITIAVFSFVYGNPLRLINGFDSFGNTCGVESNYHFANYKLSGINTADKPYVFFLDMSELRRTLKICVRTCPTRDIINAADLYRFYKETNSQLCRYDFNMTLLEMPIPRDLTYFHVLGPCPVLPIRQGTPILHRCVPIGGKFDSVYDTLNSWSGAQQLFSDLYTTWPTILMMCCVAFVLSIVVIGLMSVITSMISWVICIFAIVSSVAVTIVLWLTYIDIQKTKDYAESTKLEEFVRNETFICATAIIATVIMVKCFAYIHRMKYSIRLGLLFNIHIIIVIIIVCILRKKLSGLAALFEEASNCMLEMPSLILPSVLATFVLSLFLTFWVTVVVCLVTTKELNQSNVTTQISSNGNVLMSTGTTQIIHKFNDDTDYKSIEQVEYLDFHLLQNMLWVYIIGLIWTVEFIFACQQLVLAAAVAFWYFRKPTDSPVGTALCKLVKYHLGSAAKGSILILLFKLPRLILTYLYAKLKKRTDAGSECAQCCMKSCICCFWFLEKFIRFLNHNAYTVIAIENINFCPAAGVAWNALMANSLQVATINGIGDFILFLGKLAVGLICGLISVLLLRNREDLHFYIIPCIFITFFSYFIAHIILSLFEMVVDTLFLCVCEDRAINGPSGRYRESKLAHLLGEEPIEQLDGQMLEGQPVEETMRQVEMAPINRQPFSAHA